jgi:general secretion pathway protein D
MRIEMRLSWARLGLLAVLTGAVVAPLSVAKAQQASDVRVDLNLKDADMMVATNTLFQRTGIQFVYQPSSEPYQRVTLKLDGVTPEDAVRYICQAAGAYFKRDDNGVYIISHVKPPVETPVATTPTKSPKVLRRLKVLKAGAKDVYDMLLFGLSFDVTRGLAELRKFTDMGAQSELNRLYGGNFNPMQIQTSQTTFQPINASAPPRAMTSAESGGDVRLPGSEAAGQLGAGGGGGFGGGGGGLQGGGGGGAGRGGGGAGGAGGAGGQATPLVGGQGLVGESIDFVSYDPTDNSLLVRGNEDDINQLQTYITEFDVAPRQVEIKVEFITTTDTISSDFGAEFLYQRGTMFAGTTPGSFVNTSDPVFFNYATGDVSARLRTSLSEGTGKVVAAPIIRTLNNQPASIASQITTYFFYNLTTVSNGTVITTPQPQALNASTFLSVAPRINNDDTITLYLSPQIQNFVGFSEGPDGEQIPNTSTQSINVVARVKNNQTIVLGGLNQKNESETQNKVPVLAELPIIGQFFRESTKNKTNSELLIFVTPSIVEDDSAGNPGGP